MSNEKKSEQLGMSYGKANNILRKSIIFRLAQQCGMTKCFQCGETIDDVDNFSIEHKTPWLDSDNATELFFSMDNIAFSHTKCNFAAARRPEVKRISEEALKSNIAKSGFIGVYHHKDKAKPWQARPWLGDKMYSKGYYLTPEGAAKAVDEALVKHYGENVITNESLGLL